MDLIVAPMEDNDVILGMPWLDALNPHPDWRSGTLTFIDQHGTRHVWKKLARGLQPYVQPSESKPRRVATSGLNLITTKQLDKQHRQGEIELACLIFPQAILGKSPIASTSSRGRKSSESSDVNEVGPSSIAAKSYASAIGSTSKGQLTQMAMVHNAYARGHRVSAAELSAAVTSSINVIDSCDRARSNLARFSRRVSR
jgi:hypothetical protein